MKEMKILYDFIIKSHFKIFEIKKYNVFNRFGQRLLSCIEISLNLLASEPCKNRSSPRFFMTKNRRSNKKCRGGRGKCESLDGLKCKKDAGGEWRRQAEDSRNCAPVLRRYDSGRKSLKFRTFKVWPFQTFIKILSFVKHFEIIFLTVFWNTEEMVHLFLVIKHFIVVQIYTFSDWKSPNIRIWVYFKILRVPFRFLLNFCTII